MTRPDTSRTSDLKERKESFVRWQGITITQLGYALNLVLGLATASLGFALALITNKDFAPGDLGRSFLALSLMLLIVSILMGLLCVINRLRDFRLTKDIANEQRKCDGVPDPQTKEDLNAWRAKTIKLGNHTWFLFMCHVGAFFFGVLFLMAAFVAVYHAKLEFWN